MGSPAVTITPDIEPQGVVITPDQPAQNTPQATISAQPEPTGVMDRFAKWTDNVANDIKHGTDLTGIGTVLKKMGAHGVYNGNPEAVGDFMASLPLGLLKASKGAAEMQQPGKTLQGAGNVISGGLQAATIPSAFVAPEAGEVAAAVPGKVAGAISDLIPSKSAAGALFQDVAKDANKVPVALKNSQEAALRLIDWQKKTQLGPTINKFLNRITNPKLGPMDYEEARGFQQLISELSTGEKMRLSGPVQFDLNRLAAGLKADIGEAAGRVGRGADYSKAMQDYHSAARLSDAVDAIKDVATREAVKGVLRGLGYGAGGYAAYKLFFNH